MPVKTNVLLAVHCKKSDALDLKGPVTTYIANTYSDEQANDAVEDLEEISMQRTQIIGTSGSLPSLRDTLTKYFRSLSTMETRFPISKDSDHVRLSFAWHDAFRPAKRSEQHSIHYEKAAVLFNLAAVQSQQALQADRGQDQGVKDAARFFQEAAGTFAYLRDSVSLKVEAPRPLDVSPECAGMLEKLMLAQAQECVFEKATMDGKTPALLARIAKQVAVLYEGVQQQLQVAPLSQHFDRSWMSHITVKAVFYHTQAALCSANAFRAEEEIHKEIARLREAQKLLAPARKEVKACSKELAEAVKGLEDTLARNLAKAERENATVYLLRVPAASDLPDVAGAMLVKPLPPVGLDASGETLFNSVIPDTSAKALSRYTEMLDGLVREQTDKLDAASDEARIRLREWEMPESLKALDAGSVVALPDGIKSDLEQLEDHGGARYLHEIASQVRELRRVAEEELDKCTVLLDAEAAEDVELRQAHGSAWNRPVSAALNSSLREKIAGYRANLAAAGESDARLEQKLAENNASFQALSIDSAASQMPRLQAPMVTVGDMEPATVVATLRQALDALNELSNQRASLEEALKEEKRRDNILPKLMASAQNYDALFAAELRKYDGLKGEIGENVERQRTLLGVIAHNQAAFKTAFGFNEWRRACEAAAAGVRAKLQAYREVRDNLSEGLRFYMSLQEAVTTLQQQIGDFCLTRRIQREEMMEERRRVADEDARSARAAAELAAQERAQQQLGGLSLQHSSSATYASQSPHQAQPQAYPPAYQPAQQQQPQQSYGGYGAPAPQQPAPAPPQHSPYPQPQYQPPAPYGHQQPAAYQNESSYAYPPPAQPPTYYSQPSQQQPQQHQQQYGQHPPPPQQHSYGQPSYPAPQYQEQPQYAAQPQQPQQSFYGYQGQQAPSPAPSQPPPQQQAPPSHHTNPLWGGR